MQNQHPIPHPHIITSHRRLVSSIYSLPSAICYLLTSILYLLSPAFCPAADVSVSATVEPAEMRPGGYASYVITIEGGQPDEAPQLQLPVGVENASANPSFSNQTSIINGVVSRSASLTWQITVSNAGERVIPPQEIHIGGKPYRTNEVRITVKDNPASPVSQFDPLLTIETTKREIYLGEVIPLTVNLYVHRNTALRRIGLIEIPKDNFAIQRFPLQPEESTVNMGGAPFRALAFRSTLSALKAGNFKLGPASSEIIIDVPIAGGRQLNPFFGQSETRRVKPQGNEIEMNVLPLPEAGKPANFSGVVGDFQMTATAEPHETMVGDPISVEISVTGSGNFDSLSAPMLATSEDWKTYPAKRINIARPDPTSDNQQTHATFNQVIIPKKVVTAVPSFEFSYFNPEKKKYSTARTDPIPLRVKPGAVQTQPALQTGITSNGGDRVQTDADKVPPVQPHITDIVTMMPPQTAWLTARPPLMQDRTFLIWNAGALGALSLLVCGKLFTTYIRARNAAPDAPIRRIWSQLRRARMTRGDFYQSAARYVHQRAQNGTGMPSAWQTVLDRNDALNYSRSSEEALKSISSAERREVLRSIQG